MPARIRRLALAVALLSLGAAAVLLAPRGPDPFASSGERLLLPDLDQRVPYEVAVEAVPARPGRWRLVFASAVDNVGEGPLIVEGRRRAGQLNVMTADQVVRAADRSTVRRPNVGFLRYTFSEDHDHWHYLGFDRYSLRDPRTGRRVVNDRKTGFCLGDRYRARRRDVAEPEFARSRCGLGATRLTRIVEGISVGWGDDYHGGLEGQELDVTNVRAGEYVLVHHANADRRLAELSHRNNVASARIRLTRRPDGRPVVRVVRTCDSSATCPPRVRR